MGKTDKEITAEIVVAAINANSRLVYGNNNMLAKPMSASEIVSLIKNVHQTLQSLKESSTK